MNSQHIQGRANQSQAIIVPKCLCVHEVVKFMTADSDMVITFLEVLSGQFTVATPTGQRAPSEKLEVSYIHVARIRETISH